MHSTLVPAVVGAALVSGPALAAITITQQGAPAPTYDTLITFDEPGQATGVVPADYWQADYGIVIEAGDLVPQVDDFDPIFGPFGLGDMNSYFGNFGVFMTFDDDVTELSMQVWDPSGPPSPFGGGLGVFVFNDGVEVANFFTTPAWGGIGDTWFDITTTDGDVFDDVRVLGFGFFPTTFVDNLSWNAAAGSVLTLALDIKPGGCPNSFNRNSNGVMPAALLGGGDVDATMIDLSTVAATRGDGVGGAVAPLEGPPGPHSTIDDVATPWDGEACGCHDLGGDGIDDLSMKFRTQDLVEILELDALPAGALVELVVSGNLLDGTPFTSSDCIRLVPPGTAPGMVAVTAPAPGAWIGSSPLDLQLDGGGFGAFERTFPLGTTVTLTAESTYLGAPFVGWMVDGRMLRGTGTDLVFDVVGDAPRGSLGGDWQSTGGSAGDPGSLSPR